MVIEMNKFLLCVLLIILLACHALAEATPGTQITGMELIPAMVSIRVGETEQLQAIWITDDMKHLTWSSSNPDIATVGRAEYWYSPDALVAGISPGTATITVRDSRNYRLSATCVVTVTSITTNDSSGCNVGYGSIPLLLSGLMLLANNREKLKTEERNK